METKDRKTFVAACAMTALAALTAWGSLSAPARACDDPLNCPKQMHAVPGADQKIGAHRIQTWAKLNPANQVKEVGVTIPYEVIAHPPAPDAPMPGMTAASHTAPAAKEAAAEATGVAAMGAMPPQKILCVIPFPKEVKETAYFDHFEMDWNPQGHEPPVFSAPHFDFHFYAIPPAEVDAIDSFDPNPPEARFLPAGYIYPGAATYVPRMGVHTGKPSIMEPPFTAVMLAGFNKGRMHFVEPMVTQAYLARKKDFTLDVPRPRELGRKALYPTQFDATYDTDANAYHFVFSGFEVMD